MTAVTKIKIAKILYNARFWAAISVLYMMSRGFTTGEAFFIGGWYYLFSLLLEYPTGVIGDRFSHRLSVTLGYLILATGFFFMTESGHATCSRSASVRKTAAATSRVTRGYSTP